MTYKLLATDMDGTLLMDNKVLSKENIEALKKAKEIGIEIVICTGRPYVTVKPYLEKLGFDCWVVTNNGAVIRNKEGKIISVIYMRSEALEETIKLLEEETVYYHVSDEKYTFIKSIRERIRFIKQFILQTEVSYWRAILLAPWIVLCRGNHKKVDFSSFVRQGGRAASIFILSEEKEQLQKIKKKIEKVRNIDITSSGFNNIEVLDAEATKGKALEKISNLINVKKEEIIAVGDNLNDLSMIQYAGLGVAMKNGEKEVIEAANWVTTTNQEHGIAHLIEYIMAQEKEDIIVS
ncbi:Cof-type HAD-IIB family hydrolase [Clostridium formicaceticum]|uniref:Phosphatase YwpJ n=1 Tax=Clostridium formicaceticum TaxID=1497 RepID=A0AAC9RGM7_9CLOT|nr:Cof-type HAD-IIB family hydrolase [Clostridium formicaceticum]AOY76153.1 hypothetical protein BJL90_09710 [Clostridium formicaceticum]ARE86524.1 Putative phosphatase YwpJ [Clostridium formicaceticum]